jgi:Zn-dependent protease with chaperone function
LTAALDRLGLWEDALGLAGEAEFGEDGWMVALLWGLARGLAWVAGASWCLGLTRPMWMAFWRSRERAADAFAAELGQAEPLAVHLEAVEKPRERPRRYRFFDPYGHEPVALRVERLRVLARGGE